jgi:hypothetical protein
MAAWPLAAEDPGLFIHNAARDQSKIGFPIAFEKMLPR